MKGLRIFQILLVLGTVLCFTAIWLFFKQTPQPVGSALSTPGLLAQNNYMGPIKPIPGNPYLVRIEILVKDSPELGGVQIEKVTFNGEELPLKPRDIYGNRGSSSFQLPPGKYELRWTVQRDKKIWPRTITHEEIVTIDRRDQWIQVSIEGEKASIN
jgi:hypothetical protein